MHCSHNCSYDNVGRIICLCAQQKAGKRWMPQYGWCITSSSSVEQQRLMVHVSVKGKLQSKTINRTVEVLVKQPAEVTIKEIKHMCKQFEAAMDAVTSRLEKVIQTEANRPARIVISVEVPVMDSSKASTMCIKLRGEYFIK